MSLYYMGDFLVKCVAVQPELQIFTESVHPYRDHQRKTRGPLLLYRFTHFNACVLWECVWEGLALC